jgi:hypothetical protein
MMRKRGKRSTSTYKYSRRKRRRRRRRMRRERGRGAQKSSHAEPDCVEKIEARQNNLADPVFNRREIEFWIVTSLQMGAKSGDTLEEEEPMNSPPPA